MDHGSENSKLAFGEQEQQYTLPYFSYYPSFSLFTPNNHTLFSMEFTDLNNARAEADTGSSNCFTPNEDSLSGYCDVLGDQSDTDSSNEEVSLDELLLDGKTKEKIELLAAMVGVDTTDPAIVLNEVVRVLKVLKRMNQY